MILSNSLHRRSELENRYNKTGKNCKNNLVLSNIKIDGKG